MGRRPFFIPSSGNTTSISFFLFPLPDFIQCSNGELRNKAPEYPESSEFLDLTVNLGDVFVCIEFLLLLLSSYGPTKVCLVNYDSVYWFIFLLLFLFFPQDLIQEINELRLRVGEMDNERFQYEKKLKTTKVCENEEKKQ